MTKLVIGRALLRIAEDFVGLLGLLEARFSLGVVGIAIGVIFHREPAIGFLEVGFADPLLHTQHFVVIALCHISRSLYTTKRAGHCQPVHLTLSPPPGPVAGTIYVRQHRAWSRRP